jgi:hypothetical protein
VRASRRPRLTAESAFQPYEVVWLAPRVRPSFTPTDIELESSVPAPQPVERYFVQCASLPGTGLPMRATGMKKHIWPIAIVSVHRALVS